MEVRSWAIQKGTLAAQAAAVIHTDFERDFISAKCCKFEDIVEFKGDEEALRNAGRQAVKGRDYVVQDGDLMDFNIKKQQKNK
jgi:ribosome-binding ATPase YchF (GTP1/OBG family)